MIFKSFLKTIHRFRMLEKSRTVYVACSGGPDSTALLHLFITLSRQQQIRLGVIHLNHGLRGRAAERDRKAVEKVAKRLGLPFVSGKVDVKKLAKAKRYSIEEAAREARYQFFVRMAKRHRIDVIALGHTMDDQAETVLMRILTGAGVQGLGGSRAVFNRGGVTFIRPLIQIEKKEVLQFLREKHLPFQIDRTNTSLQFLRNRIRHKLIPYLRENFSPGISKVLARLPEILRADVDFLEQEAKHFYKRLRRKKEEGIDFAKGPFEKLHPAMQFRLLKFAAQELGSQEELAFVHWQAFQELMAGRKTFRVSFPWKIVCVVSKTSVGLQESKNRISSAGSQEHKKSSRGGGMRLLYRLRLKQKLYLPNSKCWIECKPLLKKPAQLKKKSENYAIVDRAKLQFPLAVRNRLPGDVFQPLGQAKPLRLKNFLISRKVPRERRDRLPIILSGSRIIWVGGVGISEAVKVTDRTKKLVKLKIV